MNGSASRACWPPNMRGTHPLFLSSHRHFSTWRVQRRKGPAPTKRGRQRKRGRKGGGRDQRAEQRLIFCPCRGRARGSQALQSRILLHPPAQAPEKEPPAPVPIDDGVHTPLPQEPSQKFQKSHAHGVTRALDGAATRQTSLTSRAARVSGTSRARVAERCRAGGGEGAKKDGKDETPWRACGLGHRGDRHSAQRRAGSGA